MASQPKQDKPFGMEPYDLGGPDDLGALSAEQQEKLNDFKPANYLVSGEGQIKTRQENEVYLRDHPEVECLMAGFLGEVLNKRPENIRDFAAAHFTDPELPAKLQKELEERHEILQRNKVLKRL